MNAPVAIDVSLQGSHRRALEAANKWRGRCVNQFARGERLISEALHSRDPGAPLPKMVAQRCEKLAPNIDESAGAAISAFRALSDSRNSIVHGDGRVFIDQSGKWLLKLVLFDRDGPREWTIDEPTAETFYCNVKAIVQRLEAKLAA